MCVLKTILLFLTKSYFLGARYSVLHQLEYFDPIRFHVVDPMHNLLLGVAKHVFKLWVDQKILTDSQIEEIDRMIKRIKV